jgi:hypothetical protein
LREDELNTASPQFVSLFLQGNSEKELAQHKQGWEQARFIASAMSKEAGKIKFWWEKKQISKVNVPDDVWEKFTLTTDGVELNAIEAMKIVNGSR